MIGVKQPQNSISRPVAIRLLFAVMINQLLVCAAHAFVLEFLSEGAHFIAGNDFCPTYKESDANAALQKALSVCTQASSSFERQSGTIGQIALKLDENLEDSLFSSLALRHSKSLACFADFASGVSKGDSPALDAIMIRAQIARVAKRQLLDATNELSSNHLILNKVCPLGISDLQSQVAANGEDPSTWLCRKIITARISYQAALNSIPLAGVSPVKEFLDHYTNLPDGSPSMEESALRNNLKAKFQAAQQTLLNEATRISRTATSKGGAAFDRRDRHTLLSDPLIVNQLIRDSGDSVDLRGLACRADARYGSGADALDTGIVIGTFATGGAGALARTLSVGAKIARGAAAARGAGLLPVSATRTIQAAAMANAGLYAWNTLDKNCFNSESGPDFVSKNKRNSSNDACAVAPSLDSVESDNCVLAATLSGVGFTAVFPFEGAKKLISLLSQPGKIIRSAAQATAVNLEHNVVSGMVNGADGAKQVSLDLGQRLGSGMFGSAYDLKNATAFCPNCSAVVKFPHKSLVTHPGSKMRETTSAGAIEEEVKTYNALSEQVKKLNLDDGKDAFAWPADQLPTAKILGTVQTEHGPALVKMKVPGRSLDKILAEDGAAGLTEEMAASLREIAKYELRLKDLANPSRRIRGSRTGHEHLIIDANPSNLVWVDDPKILAEMGMKRPSFMFYEMAPLQFRNNTELKQIVESLEITKGLKADDQKFVWSAYLLKKAKEFSQVDRSASEAVNLRARLVAGTEARERVAVPVSQLASIHPIDRPAALSELAKRRQAFKENEAMIRGNPVLLSKELDTMAPSKNPIRAVRMQKNCYVVFDGNGRVAALRDAIPDIGDARIEVELWRLANPEPIVAQIHKVMEMRGLKACP